MKIKFFERIIFYGFVLMISFGGCACKPPAESQKIQFGTYYAKLPNKLIDYFKQFFYNEIHLGYRLILNADSTFSVRTCGDSLSGDFFVRNDSLILHYKSDILLSNSTEQIKSPYFFGYKINRDGTFINKEPGTMGSKEVTFVHKLEIIKKEY